MNSSYIIRFIRLLMAARRTRIQQKFVGSPPSEGNSSLRTESDACAAVFFVYNYYIEFHLYRQERPRGRFVLALPAMLAFSKMLSAKPNLT